MLMSEEKLRNLVEALIGALETKDRQDLRGQLKRAIESAERRGMESDTSFYQRKEALESLKAFESWWRLPNDKRTIEAIEPAMCQCLEVIHALEETDRIMVGALCDTMTAVKETMTGTEQSPQPFAEWQPATLDEAKLVADEHMRLYGIEYDSDGGSYVSRKIATRSVAERILKPRKGQ